MKSVPQNAVSAAEKPIFCFNGLDTILDWSVRLVYWHEKDNHFAPLLVDPSSWIDVLTRRSAQTRTYNLIETPFSGVQ